MRVAPATSDPMPFAKRLPGRGPLCLMPIGATVCTLFKVTLAYRSGPLRERPLTAAV